MEDDVALVISRKVVEQERKAEVEYGFRGHFSGVIERDSGAGRCLI